MARRPRKNKFRKKFTKLMQKKLVLLFAGIVLAFALLVGRITYINAFNGDKYSKIVLDQQQYQSRTIPFKRGDIVDRNGTKLATSQRVYNVILDAKVLLSDETTVMKNMLNRRFRCWQTVLDLIKVTWKIKWRRIRTVVI